MITTKKYDIIYADPPWKYNDKSCAGNAAQHYSTMSLKDICGLPVKDLASDNCALFLWATYPTLPDAFEVIKAWGFNYRTLAFQWVKLNRSGQGFFFGIGHWTRSNSEACLLAVKGKPQRVDNSISQLVVSPLQRHSQKPAEVRDKIVRLVGDRPRIELFAREKVEGWDCWGNEVQE